MAAMVSHTSPFTKKKINAAIPAFFKYLLFNILVNFFLIIVKIPLKSSKTKAILPSPTILKPPALINAPFAKRD